MIRDQDQDHDLNDVDDDDETIDRWKFCWNSGSQKIEWLD